MRNSQKQQIKKNLWSVVRVSAWAFVIAMGLVVTLVFIGLIALLS